MNRHHFDPPCAVRRPFDRHWAITLDEIKATDAAMVQLGSILKAHPLWFAHAKVTGAMKSVRKAE